MLIFRRVSVTLLVRGLSAVASIALAALVTSVYSLGKFGEFSFALMTAKTVAGIALFSLNSVLLKLLLRDRADERAASRAAMIRECGGMATLISLVVALAILAAALLALELGAQPEFWMSMILVLPIIPLQNITMIHGVILRAERRDAPAQALMVGIPTILPPLLVGAGALVGHVPRFLPEVASTVSCLIAVIAGIPLARTAPFLHVGASLRAVLRGQWRVLRHSWVVHLANMMNYLSDWYGTMLLAATQSMEMTGALRIIQQFGAAFQLMTVSVEAPLSTEIGRAHLARNHARARRLLRKSQLVLGVAGGGLALVAALLSGPILAAFKALSPDVQIALVVFLAFQAGRLATGAASSALFLMDATGQLVRASMIAMVLMALVQSMMVPFFGIIGASAGLGAGVLVRAVVNYVYVMRELRRQIGPGPGRAQDAMPG